MKQNAPKDMRNARAIRELYLKSGYSYTEFSRITGISYGTVAGWLTGKRNPPDYVVEAVKVRLEANRPRKKKR